MGLEVETRYEPYIQGSAPLPKKRNRDVPPLQYAVPPCVAENEGSAFSCPHLGCDGISFDTAWECHEHEDQHHSPPYWCGECKASYASQPALERHVKASGHVIWVCEENGCDMQGIQFANREAYLAHALESLSHRKVGRRCAAKQDYYVDHYFSLDEDDGPTHYATCLQPFCFGFDKTLSSKAEWDKHLETHGHVKAVELAEAVAGLDLPKEVLEERQANARLRRCDVVECQQHGKVFSNSQKYFGHIETRGHTNPGAKTVRSVPAVETVCDVAECPKNGKTFRGLAWFKHAGGAGHVRAVRFAEALKAARADSSGLSEPPTPASEMFAAYTTPRKGPSAVQMPITPTSPGTMTMPTTPVRDEGLERQNRELRELVEVLTWRIAALEERSKGEGGC